jgi:curved DNA-binding protein CbpA
VARSETTYYERLGVEPSASQAEIRAAYRVLARRNHPDLADGAEPGDMAAVNEAWRVLGDAERRAEYDATLPSFRSKSPEPAVNDHGPATIDVDVADDNEDDDDWRLDLPITDGRAVRTFGLMVAVAAGLALGALIALFGYAILWAG